MFCRLLVLGALLWASAVSSPAAVQHVEYHPMLESFAPDPNIVRFAHEISCHLFYHKLSEEDISIKECPADKLFDYLEHRCVEKEFARCWNHLMKDKNHEYVQFNYEQDRSRCPNPFGSFPDVTDCTRYYQCLSGNAQHKKCAPNKYFDKIKRKCMLNNAICADHTDVTELDVRCPKPWQSFAHPKDCSKYYTCWENLPDLRTCNNRMLLDQRKMKCMPQANCGSRYNPYAHPTTQPISTTKEVQETSPPTTEIPKTSYDPIVTKENSKEDVIAEKTDQTTVEPVVTEELTTTEKVTSEEIPFETTVETKESSTENIPTTEQNKECHSGDQTCILDEDGDVLRCPSPDGLFPHPKDLHQFLHCSHNAIFLKKCPQTLIFIESMQACSWDTSELKY